MHNLLFNTLFLTRLNQRVSDQSILAFDAPESPDKCPWNSFKPTIICINHGAGQCTADNLDHAKAFSDHQRDVPALVEIHKQLWWRYTHSSGGDACHGTPMVDTWCIPGGGESGWMPQVINRQPSLAWSTYLHARTAINKQRLTNSGFELIGSTQPELLVGGKTRKTDLSKCANVYIFS